MADKKLSQLTQNTTIAAADILHLEEISVAGVDKHITFNDLVESILNVVTTTTVIESDDYIAFQTSSGTSSKILLTDLADQFHKGLEDNALIDGDTDDLIWSDGVKTHKGNSLDILKRLVTDLTLSPATGFSLNEYVMINSSNVERVTVASINSFFLTNIDSKADSISGNNLLAISDGSNRTRSISTANFMKEAPSGVLNTEGVVDPTDEFLIIKGGETKKLPASALPSVGTPTGVVLTFAGEIAPTGFLIANGNAVSRTTYANLFSVIGVIYGAGDGSTTFNLPDLRGQFPRFTDQNRGKDPDAGIRINRGDGTGGDNVGTTQGFEIQSHLHAVGNRSGVGGSGTNAAQGSNGSTSQQTGETGGLETRPTNIGLLGIIKY